MLSLASMVHRILTRSDALRNQFVDRTEAISFLAEHLARDGVGPHANALAQALVDEWQVAQPNKGGDSSHRAVFKPTRWVIRNEDLQLLSSLFGLLKDVFTDTAIFSGALSESDMLNLALSVGKALTKLALNLHKKGVQLGQKEFFVLMLLREDSSGKQLVTIEAAFHARFGSDHCVLEVLEKLEKCPTRAGDIELVRAGENDNWFAQDV